MFRVAEQTSRGRSHL